MFIRQTRVNGNNDIVQLLLSCPNIEFNARTNIGVTAFIFACFEGHTNVVKMLLSDSITKEEGLTAFIAACMNRQKDTVKLLLEYFDIEVSDTSGLPQEMRDFIELHQEASKELKRFNEIHQTKRRKLS